MGLFDGSGLSEYQEAPAPTMFDTAGVPSWDQHAQDLAKDPTTDPIDLYRNNPSDASLDLAKKVYRAKNPPSPPLTVSGFINGIKDLPSWDHVEKAIGDVGQFASGVAKGIPNLVSSMYGTVKHAVGNAVTSVASPLNTGSDLDAARAKLDAGQPLTDDEKKLMGAQLEGDAALQQGGFSGIEAASNAADYVQRKLGLKPDLNDDKGLGDYIQKQAAFRDEEQKLKSGNIEQGIFGPSNLAGLSPDQVKQLPVDPNYIQSQADLTSPQSFATMEGLGAASPIASRYVTAPILKGAGKAISATGEALGAISPGATLTGTAVGALAHPVGAVLGGVGKQVAQKILPKVGDFLTATGEEAAGAAPAEGQSLLGKMIKGAISGGTTGGVLSTPFALASDNPEQAGEQVGGGVGLGTVLGSGSAGLNSRNIDLAARDNTLKVMGKAVQYGLGADEEHLQQMPKLPQSDQDFINKVRAITSGFTNSDGSPMQVNAVSGPTFAAKAKAAGGTGVERGMMQDADGIWINADNPANQQVGGATGTTGHEFGHLADNLSALLGDRMQGTFSQSLGDTMMPNGKPTDAFQKFINGYSKARGQQIDSKTGLKEFTAETSRYILGGGNIEQFTLPPTLMDQVKSGVGDWFKRMGIGVGNDKMFSWQEVPQVTSQLKDLFHEIGQTGYQNLQEGNDASQNPNARTELRQVQAQLDDLYSIPDKDKTSAHYNQIDQLENRQDTLERQMGISQWVPGTPATPAATPQATAPQTATPTPAAPQAAPVGAPAQPTPTPTAPVSTPITPSVEPEKPNLPQQKLPISPNPDLPTNAKPAIAPEVEDILPKSTATMEKPFPVDPTLPGTGQDVAPVPERTPEDIKGITDQAEADTKDSDTWKRARSQNKKDDLVRQAKIKALVEELAPNEPGLKKVTDEDGKETIQGHLDPENPIHQEIAKLAGVTPEQLENLNALHENEGNHTYVDYKSAPKKEGADLTAEQREKEYEASSAADRVKGGESQLQTNKSVVPITPKLTKDGKIVARFVSPDRILSNVRHVMDAAQEHGITTGYEGLTGDQLDKQVTQDFQDVVKNHKNGFTNTGKPFSKFGDTLAPNPNPDAVGIKIPRARADVINMALNDQGALGVTKPEGTKAHVKGNEAVNLARENQGYLNPETGETNALRDQLTQKGFDPSKVLEKTIETLKPELITSVHSGIIGPKDIVRPSGFDIDTEAMTKGGLPNATMTRAGFMPDAATSNAESGTEKRLTPKELLASVRNAQPVAKSDSDTTPNGDGGASSSGAVQAIEAAVRGSHKASQAAQLGFHEDKDAQFQALADAAKSNGLANAKLPQQWHPNRPDNVGGSEHDVFHDEPSDRFVKISKGAGYYPEATQRGWGMRAATPSEYFEKLKGLKDQWGLDTQIHGINLGHKESQPSFITSQPNIHPKLDAQGDPVRLSQPEITAHLAEKGFKPVGNEEDAMYYRPEDNMLIADAHPGNVIEKEDGTPSSFDTINIHPTGPLKDYVTRKMAPRPSDLNTRLKEALEKTFATSSAERWKDLDPEPTGTKKKELQLQP